MNLTRTCVACVAALLVGGSASEAQVYSPHVMRSGQVDTRTLGALAQGICERAGARTGRQKAEAIWRFFLTDGRFVKPGFWYHIAGWAYEEPRGEVLDPLKQLNSYGFGLCYQVAPLLEAVWEAAGFDARVWFLTGHTVAEVFYDNAYHHFDSDMMGYTTVGKGDFRELPVASVRQLEQDGGIILGKLRSPTETVPNTVDEPWYTADLRAGAIDGLAELFTSTRDNWLYPFKRYPQGHTMDFVLRPGERMIRYFQPEDQRLCYLPFQFDGTSWREFPHEVKEYGVRTQDGPQSQKDSRRWATGRIEYTPVLSDGTAYFPSSAAGLNENLRLPRSSGGLLTRAQGGRPARAVFDMPSPYVIIDAAISLDATLRTSGERLEVETSTDAGQTWDLAGTLTGPHKGRWQATSGIKARGEHGTLTAVGGTYGYLVRLSLLGSGAAEAAGVSGITITTRFQLNPRTLPALEPGRNGLIYQAGARERRYVIPLDISQKFARRAANARYVAEGGQGYLAPVDGKQPAEFVIELAAPDGSALSGFDAGGHFLDIRDGLAPDKFTAEVRKTASRSTGDRPAASLAWSTSPDGEYKTLWTYQPRVEWKDGDPIDRLLRWPEVDRSVRDLPHATKKVYVRYRIENMALDDLRLAAIAPGETGHAALEITHIWREHGSQKKHVERVSDPASEHRYSVDTGASGPIENEALILSVR